MLASGFMIARAAMRCSNQNRAIAVFIAHMEQLPVRLYKKGRLVVVNRATTNFVIYPRLNQKVEKLSVE